MRAEMMWVVLYASPQLARHASRDDAVGRHERVGDGRLPVVNVGENTDVADGRRIFHHL
jgi:hypothetical protein